MPKAYHSQRSPVNTRGNLAVTQHIDQHLLIDRISSGAVVHCRAQRPSCEQLIYGMAVSTVIYLVRFATSIMNNVHDQWWSSFAYYHHHCQHEGNLKFVQSNNPKVLLKWISIIRHNFRRKLSTPFTGYLPVMWPTKGGRFPNRYAGRLNYLESRQEL